MEKKLMPHIIDHILNETKINFQTNNCITDEILMSMFSIFGSVAKNALELIDNNNITLMKLKGLNSHDFLFKVNGSSGTSYILLPKTNYCQCIFYNQKVLNSRSSIACKHFVAANYAWIWGKYTEFEISVEVYQQYINDLLCSKLDTPIK